MGTDFPKTFAKRFLVLKAVAHMTNLRKYKLVVVEFCEKPVGSHHPALRHSKYAISLAGWRKNNSKFNSEPIRSHIYCDVGQAAKRACIFANFSCLQRLLKQKNAWQMFSYSSTSIFMCKFVYTVRRCENWRESCQPHVNYIYNTHYGVRRKKIWRLRLQRATSAIICSL